MSKMVNMTREAHKGDRVAWVTRDDGWSKIHIARHQLRAYCGVPIGRTGDLHWPYDHPRVLLSQGKLRSCLKCEAAQRKREEQ